MLSDIWHLLLRDPNVDTLYKKLFSKLHIKQKWLKYILQERLFFVIVC